MNSAGFKNDLMKIKTIEGFFVSTIGDFYNKHKFENLDIKTKEQTNIIIEAEYI